MAKNSMLNNSKLQAFLAIGPFAMIFILIISYFVFVFGIIGLSIHEEVIEEGNSVGFPIGFAVGMGIFVALFFATIIASIFSWIYFLIHAIKNPNYDGMENQNNRVIWVLVIALISGFGPLIYWLVEIKSKHPKPYIPS